MRPSQAVKLDLPLIVLRHLMRKLRSGLRQLHSGMELRWALATHQTDWLLRRRFNRWARDGRGESMERHHSRIAGTIWERMELHSTVRVLDIGCGQGWALRLIARRAPEECVLVGLDISDEMIRLARESSHSYSNMRFHCGQAQNIPEPDSYFTKIISIEAFYYFERPEDVLRELFRVAQPGGELYLLICFFQEDPKPEAWFKDIRLPVHNRAIPEYENMLRRSGWTRIVSEVFDFRAEISGEQDEAHERPLLLMAMKPY